MGRVEICQVTADPLDLQNHVVAVTTPASGAVSSFLGIVRDHDHGASVSWLEYSAHPSAPEVLGRLASQVAARADVHAVAVSHRVDATLQIGDVAIVCAVSASHRREAFEACEELVERVKAELPVWKLQTLADGTQDWVNCP